MWSRSDSGKWCGSSSRVPAVDAASARHVGRCAAYHSHAGQRGIVLAADGWDRELPQYCHMAFTSWPAGRSLAMARDGGAGRKRRFGMARVWRRRWWLQMAWLPPGGSGCKYHCRGRNTRRLRAYGRQYAGYKCGCESWRTRSYRRRGCRMAVGRRFQ